MAQGLAVIAVSRVALFAVCSIVLSGLTCLVAFLVSIVATLALDDSVSIPGMTRTTLGEGDELASTQFVPTTAVYLIGLAAVYLVAMLVVARRRSVR